MTRRDDDTPRHLAYEPDWRTGDELSPATRRDALARYVHRYTGEHVPAWATTADPRYFEGGRYPVQFATDADWLKATHFAVTKSGKLNNRYRHCETGAPDWPNNPELQLQTRPATEADKAANLGCAPAHLARIIEHGKFEGERVAVFMAHAASLDGTGESFGDVNEGGFFCRVLFDASPHLVCFVETESGFVREITNSEYEAAHADHVEQSEQED